jgi:arsenate reductase
MAFSPLEPANLGIFAPISKFLFRQRNSFSAILLTHLSFFAYFEQNKKQNKEEKEIKILILCTGNSCRSQMAEGFLKSFDPALDVYSAGTEPSSAIHPKAVRVMQEIGIDISHGRPKNVEQFLTQNFDYVITVCDHAKETCPVFSGKVAHRLHIGFDDPAEATGSEEEVLAVFRRVRDEIKNAFQAFYRDQLQGK